MAEFGRVEEVLHRLGYGHLGNLGVDGREAFGRMGDLAPTDGSGRARPEHHLNFCTVTSRELRQHLALRDWLRANPKGRLAYGTPKRALAERHPLDIDAYCDAKTEFVEEVLAKTEQCPDAVIAHQADVISLLYCKLDSSCTTAFWGAAELGFGLAEPTYEFRSS